jgi:chloramphenicol O-acetyltransferase type B
VVYYERRIAYCILGEKVRLILGEGTYGTIEGEKRGTVKVGRYCSLGSGIKALFLPGHRIDWVSTYPFPVKWKLPIEGHPVPPGTITIGNDVWIGRDVTLVSGAKINDGAVIGAYSVVAGKVPPYAIVVGNPAKILRKRFSDDIIYELLKISWWNWPKEKIALHVELLCSDNVESFIQKAQEIL